MRLRISLILLLAVVLVALAWYLGLPGDANRQEPLVSGTVPRPGVARPNVVMIVLDTVRRDHLSCYGYGRDTSPNLSRLCETARRFDRAYSTSCWTIPAHASLFTGLFAVAHGATQENPALDTSLRTLAEILSENGYATVGITENPMLAVSSGFAQGFHEYVETWRLPPPDGGDENAALSAFRHSLETLPSGKPFFVFVNLIEAHSPYDSSGPFRNRFITDESIRVATNDWKRYFVGRRTFTENELQHLGELYDAEILYVDDVVGKMIGDLQRRNLWDEILFVVLSDHGENLGEHNLVDHVFSLNETLIQIPLIVHYAPGFASGGCDDRNVQISDLFATVLEAAHLSVERYASQGRSLVSPRSEGPRPILCEYYYPKQALAALPPEDREHPSLARYKRQLRSLQEGHLKLIWGSDGQHELYDLDTDPGEEADLAERPGFLETTRQLVGNLEGLVTQLRRGAVKPTQIEGETDEETIKALRSLGYVQ
ncbi:MAG: sulfatase [Candidatus Hydrogenedentes bacterium]|nr:sulfatase [Candidatus Hydrogenedentota bacterium]